MIDFGTIKFLDERKESIQREAYQKWLSKDCIGTLEMATGVGKTLIGIMAIQQEQLPGRIIVVTPTITLMKQWEKEIEKHLKADVGKIGGGFNDTCKRITVAVVNSVRCTCVDCDLLILDEMHRYGSDVNYKFIEFGKFKKILGLTATAYREDGAHELLFKHSPIIYRFTQKEAIKKGLLSGFGLYNVSIGLEPEERIKYMNYTNHIEQNFKRFDNNFGRVQDAIHSTGQDSWIARDLMRSFAGRKTILSTAKNKIEKALMIIDIEAERKILVFCEYIKTANELVSKLKKNGVNAGKYHSKMPEKERQEMLDDFRDNKIRVMVAVKSLDEGTDIPDSDVAIIIAGSSVKRQMIQRLGRVLRTSEGKDIAKVYQLYVPETKDQDWMRSRQAELIKNAEYVKWW